MQPIHPITLCLSAASAASVDYSLERTPSPPTFREYSPRTAKSYENLGDQSYSDYESKGSIEKLKEAFKNWKESYAHGSTMAGVKLYYYNHLNDAPYKEPVLYQLVENWYKETLFQPKNFSEYFVNLMNEERLEMEEVCEALDHTAKEIDDRVGGCLLSTFLEQVDVFKTLFNAKMEYLDFERRVKNASTQQEREAVWSEAKPLLTLVALFLRLKLKKASVWGFIKEERIRFIKYKTDKESLSIVNKIKEIYGLMQKNPTSQLTLKGTLKITVYMFSEPECKQLWQEKLNRELTEIKESRYLKRASSQAPSLLKPL